VAGVGSTKGSVAFFKPLAAYVSSANIIGQQRIRLGQLCQRMLIAEWSPPMKNEDRLAMVVAYTLLRSTSNWDST